MEEESSRAVITPAQRRQVNADQAFQKHWFCAALCKDGKVVMQDSDSPASFPEILDNSVLAWIDYRTANFETDVHSGAAQLGFSGQLVSCPHR